MGMTVPSKYKEKYTQIVINATKAPTYLYMGDVVMINLCACFLKKGNYMKYLSTIKEAMDGYKKINFCNLASTCYKLGIKYNSLECLEFIQVLIQLTRHDIPDVIFVQNGILNCGEIDCQPLQSIIKIDKEKSTLFVNNVLLECLKYLGYVSSQLWSILSFTTNFNFIIPPDIIRQLPIKNESNDLFYKTIKENLLS